MAMPNRAGCLVGIVLVTVAAVACGQEGQIEFNVQAPWQASQPVMDGAISPGEYGDSLFVSYVSEDNGTAINNPGAIWDWLNVGWENTDEDLSVTMYMAHTDEYLFLGFDVVDDFIDADEGTPTASYNDSVEIAIDGDRMINDFDEGQPNEGAEGFKAVTDANGLAGSDHGITPVDLAGPAPVGGEYTSAASIEPTEDGYTVEFQIPLASIDTSDGAEFTAAQTGDILRFNFALTDNDDEVATQQTFAMLWVVAGKGTIWSPGEDVWRVGLELSAPSTLPGDVNLDGAVNGLDVDPFVGLVTGGGFQAEADMNGDGAVNGLDVDSFVAAVVGGGVQAVPEPSTYVIALIGLVSLGLWRRPQKRHLRPSITAQLGRGEHRVALRPDGRHVA